MNIHEHQAKEILKKFGVSVPDGVVVFDVDDIETKKHKFKSENLVLKAQIHAGGRGKAGGIKIVNSHDELIKEAKKMFGKVLVTKQTGPLGRKIRRLYIEEILNIEKEFYLSCVIDRASSKIAFISSAAGGVDIEEVAKKNPEKIVTTKINLHEFVSEKDVKKIIQPFALSKELEKKAFNLIAFS